ncbi:hypothetical protein [Rhizobium leguminosarum]|uniref:hypothetical protein n=1 Tax=Rhizobium leguminosarum TaxID=384 RepID=UPI001A921D98|nr:hypothetical protein [Rhizobium leguminosarum]MBY5554127.1 hypothetical protein [Rhizobium leguminosarum]MBY5723553.1 hypothetical protein [Rhizobium leguminosarum]QSW27246.1 hypothetical protein J0664_30940 [Rhizobium leguminosarum]
MDEALKTSLLKLLKTAASDMDDCETKIKADDKSRALYELDHAADCVKKAIRLLRSTS